MLPVVKHLSDPRRARHLAGGQSQGRHRHGNQFHNKTFKVRRNGNFIKSILKTDFRQHKSIAIVTN